MVTYIGDVPVYYISAFSPDSSTRGIASVPHLHNEVPPSLGEFNKRINTFALSGTLLQDAGVTQDIDAMAMSLVGLIGRAASFNYLDSLLSRSGWLSVGSVDSPRDAESIVTREYTIEGLFLPKSIYQPRMHSVPQILTNDFSFTLGVDDCDNYIALPIGATYTGGDGSTITRSSKDGTITLVLATTLSDIKWDIGEADVDNGECKIYDENGVAEANWIPIFSREQEFNGKMVIENGLYRVIFDAANEYITIYYWSGSAYTKIDDFTCGTYTRANLIVITPDELKVRLDSGVEVEIRRGHPPMVDTGTSDLLCVTLTPADQSTSAENYLVLATSMYICSNESFSIVNSTKNLDDGKKWIFYETVSATAEDIAHQAMVDPRQVRELVGR